MDRSAGAERRKKGTGDEGPILTLEGLSKAFGGLQAVSGLDLDVFPGEILGFIGPNGAGKTTVFNMIMGVHRPDRGRILFGGAEITGRPTYHVVRSGIARTFQTPRPFLHKTIAQNIEIALIPNAIFTRGNRTRARSSQVTEFCARTGLCEALGRGYREDDCSHPHTCRCWKAYPSVLPQAGLRRLEVARALATDPALLLLDEPFAGLAQSELEELSALLRALRDEGRTLVIVDHNMQGLMKLVDRAVVIHFGRKLSEGRPEDVARDPAVQDAYLAGSGVHDDDQWSHESRGRNP